MDSNCNNVKTTRRSFLKKTGMAIGTAGVIGTTGIALAGEQPEPKNLYKKEMRDKIKICFIGGGSQTWSPNIIRDIVFKPGMEKIQIQIAVLDIDYMGGWERAQAINNLFQAKFKSWGINNRVSIYPTLDKEDAIKDSDFIIITISTGRLPASKIDLEIPDKYNIFQTVADTVGPGGWARALRNIPVFESYAKQIKELAPHAFVINYTNPAAVLTKVLANTLGDQKVVGLCHGLFSNYTFIQDVFNLQSENQIKIRFGGINHFFWVLDFKIPEGDGYFLLNKKLGGKTLQEIYKKEGDDFLLSSELYENYGYLPFINDRHICEFFNCYINSKDVIDRYKLKRYHISDREKSYDDAAKNIEKWTKGDPGFNTTPSRESAADMIKSIVFHESYIDVVNVVNNGQITNLPIGSVVETLGQINSLGCTPFTVGALPQPIKMLVQPHAENQLSIIEASQSGDLNKALMCLAAEPSSAHLTISSIKQMGKELLEPNKKYLTQFFKV